MVQGGESGRYTLGQKCDGGEETMLSGGVLGVVAPPLGEGVAEKAIKRRDLPLERGEDFPLQKIAPCLCHVTFAAGRTAVREFFAACFYGRRFFCMRDGARLFWRLGLQGGEEILVERESRVVCHTIFLCEG